MDHHYEAVKRINEAPDGKKDADVVIAVNTILDLAEIGRNEGLLALEDAAASEGMERVPGCAYLRTLILLVVDGMDPEHIRRIGELRITASMDSGYEALIRLLYLEGMRSIQFGESFRVIALKMLAMCPDRILKLFERDKEYMPGCELADGFVRQKVLEKKPQAE